MSSDITTEAVPSSSVLDVYLLEEAAAASIKINPKTLAEYRKDGVGPEYTVVARKIMYHPDKLRTWLADGGTRGAVKAKEMRRVAGGKRGR